MLMTWSKYVSLLKIGVGSGDDCIGTMTMSIKGEPKCWETKDECKPEGLSDKDCTSSTMIVVGHKRVK
jgi:hypothetical protein